MDFPKNKEQTKRRLIRAVGNILRKEGHGKLGINYIAKHAGVSKKLIYRYFGSYEGLIEAYVVETDYWMSFGQYVKQLKVPQNKEETKRLIGNLLKNQFSYFQADDEMQQLILWELSSQNRLLQSIHRTREAMGQELLQMTDHYLLGSNFNFRAIAALLVGGIYYTILHSRYSGGMFSDVDLSTNDGKQEILKAIDSVMNFVFDE